MDELPLEQVTKQLNKLINVIKIIELDADNSVTRELILVKVSANLEPAVTSWRRSQLFRAKVVDVAPDAVTIEATGNARQTAALLNVLEPFGIKELVQSGAVAVSRGARVSPTGTCAPPDLRDQPCLIHFVHLASSRS